MNYTKETDDEWELFKKQIESQIPEADRRLAQALLMEIRNERDKFKMIIDYKKEHLYYDIILKFEEYLSLKKLSVILQAKMGVQAHVEILHDKPDEVMLMFRVIKNSNVPNFKKTRPELTISSDTSITDELLLHPNDKRKIHRIAAYGANLYPDQRRVSIDFESSDDLYTVGCNNANKVDLNHCFWMINDLGPETVHDVKLVCARRSPERPCSLDVSFYRTDDEEDQEEEEEEEVRKKSRNRVPAIHGGGSKHQKRVSKPVDKGLFQRIASVFTGK